MPPAILARAAWLSVGLSSCSGGTESPDAARTDASPPTVTVSGRLTDLGGNIVTDAEVSILDSDASAVPALNGIYSITTLKDVPTALVFTGSGHVRSMMQTVVARDRVDDFDGFLPTTAEYELLESVAARPPGTGIVLITALTTGSCDVTGAHLGVLPPSGTVVYAEPDRTPNPAYSAIQPGAPGGYVIGSTGPTTPEIADVMSPCAPLPFPADPIAAVTFEGHTEVEDGGFSQAYLFVRAGP
jgi:hypothetical protein